MPKRTISPFGNFCEVQLTLPWEIAELIARHGPEIISAISYAVREHKHQLAESARLERAAAKERRKRKKAWAKATRIAIRELKRRPSEARRAVIRTIAEREGIDPATLNELTIRRERELREQRRTQRDREIVRLYFQGLSNKEIAKAVARKGDRPLHPGYISVIIARQGDLIALLRQGPKGAGKRGTQ